MKEKMLEPKSLQEVMQEKILMIIDPESSYTQEDFDKEFKTSYLNTGVRLKMPIEFVNESPNEDPTYATNGSSGFDLRANESLTLGVGKRALVSTGLFFNIPDGYEIQVRPRSGLAVKFGVTVLNSPGTVDSDYTGEVKIPLINHGEEPFVINLGDRIAQGIVSYVTASNVLELKRVNSINKSTERGAGGFGSTGNN